MALNDEITWFEQNRQFIVQQYGGQWVLVKDQTVQGAYPTYEAAFQAGAAMFPPGQFLVKQALGEEPVMMI